MTPDLVILCVCRVLSKKMNAVLPLTPPLSGDIWQCLVT